MKANSNPDIRGYARRFLYQEFPQHFVWVNQTKTWRTRARPAFAIGRMYAAAPASGERFYLRLLLTVVRGATGFESLRTVDGVVHPTFRQACLARGLLEDDGEWRLCLAEAADLQTGWTLRQLFTSILLHCQPTHPEASGMNSVPASVMTWQELSFRGSCAKHQPKMKSMTMAFTSLKG